jgi:hypothetical protein
MTTSCQTLTQSFPTINRLRHRTETCEYAPGIPVMGSEGEEYIIITLPPCHVNSEGCRSRGVRGFRVAITGLAVDPHAYRTVGTID